MGTATKVVALTPNQYELLQFVVSMHEAVRIETGMKRLGWAWARTNTFVSNREGPCFVYAGASPTHYNIRPWKKSTGEYVWRCANPLLAVGDSFAEFGDPVACAVAQEITNGQ